MTPLHQLPGGSTDALLPELCMSEWVFTCLGFSPLFLSASFTHSNSTISASSLAAFKEIAGGTECTAAAALQSITLASQTTRCRSEHRQAFLGPDLCAKPH